MGRGCCLIGYVKISSSPIKSGIWNTLDPRQFEQAMLNIYKPCQCLGLLFSSISFTFFISCGFCLSLGPENCLTPCTVGFICCCLSPAETPKDCTLPILGYDSRSFSELFFLQPLVVSHKMSKAVDWLTENSHSCSRVCCQSLDPNAAYRSSFFA